MRCFAVLILFSFAIATMSQSPVVFRSTYNASTNHQDDGVAAMGDGAGGCYSAGTAYQSSSGTYDEHVVAYDKLGSQLWLYENRMTGESERAKAIKTNPLTHEILALSSVSGAGGTRVRLLTLGADGTFHRQIDISTGTSVSTSCSPVLKVDSLGNCYVATVRSGDYLLVKFDSKGNQRWERTLDLGTDVGTPSDLAVSPFGDAFVVGAVGAHGGYVTAKYDFGGNLQWTSTYLGHHGSVLGPAFIQCLASGDPIICGSPEDSFGVPQYVIYRLQSSDGQRTWLKAYDPSPLIDAGASGLALDSRGNAFVAGDRIAGQARTVLVKYDQNGNRLWECNYIGGSPACTGVAVDAYGNPSISGFAGVTTTGLLVGYTSAGALRWTRVNVGDRYGEITADGRIGFFAIGSTFGGATNNDFVTVKIRSLPFMMGGSSSCSPMIACIGFSHNSGLCPRTSSESSPPTAAPPQPRLFSSSAMKLESIAW